MEKKEFEAALAAEKARADRAEAEAASNAADWRDAERDVLALRAVAAYTLSLAMTARAEGEAAPVLEKIEHTLLAALRPGADPETALSSSDDKA